MGVVSSPGWDRVKESFFSWDDARASFPLIRDAFWVTIKLFCVSEVIILVAGLSLALIRGTRSSVMFPLRAIAVIWVDLFRGIPTLLLVYLIGFGLPRFASRGSRRIDSGSA